MQKHFKQRLAFVLTLSMVFGLITMAAPGGKNRIARAAGPDWTTATALTPNSDGDIRIDAGGTYKLTADCKHILVEDRDPINVDLNLNGFNVINDKAETISTDRSAIHVNNGSRGGTVLNLYDTAGKSVITGKGYHGLIGIVGGGIYIEDYSKVTMYGGTIKDCVLDGITGGTKTDGAGVYVYSNSSEFTLAGGKIINNKIKNSSANGTINGIGIYAEDGANLTITGGEISGNNPDAVEPGTAEATVNGAGIYSAANNFTITGGEIKANGTQGTVVGGGIYLDSDLEMSGGVLTGNGSSGIHMQNGSLALTGTADVYDQAGGKQDIEASDKDSITFYHEPPAPASRNGYTFVLHEGSKTGTDVTAAFKGAPGKAVTSKNLWIEWKKDPSVTQTPAATTGTAATVAPSGTPAVSATPTLSAAPTASTAPTATPSVSASPAVSGSPVATASPAASSTPGPSYDKLPEEDKNILDDLITINPGLDYDTAVQIIDYANENNIDKDVLLITDPKVDDKDNDPKGSSFGKFCLRITKRYKNGLKLKWNKVKGVDGYVLYGNRCNSNGVLRPIKYVSTEGKKKTSKSISGLKKGTYYKYLMRAYKDFNGTKITVAISVCVHGTTLCNKKNTVAKNVKVFQKSSGGKSLVKKKLTVLKGKTIKLTFKEIPAEKGKKIRPHRPVLFESMDKSVFKVGKRTGKLKAVGKGKAILYAYCQNGIFKKITVVVK